MQDIWRERCNWDEELPPVLLARWSAFQSNLQAVSTIRIPRWLKTDGATHFELHGFADASKVAYAAAIYIRVNTLSGEVSQLLTAKTRVAPVKTITIPRLELCAAVLLARLLARTARSLENKQTRICAWSDSQIVLAWLRSEPSRWNIFVANRVSEIQRTLPNVSWRHVTSTDNPADIASRGTDPITLAKQALWWNGPLWLAKSSEHWPQQPLHSPVDQSSPYDETRKATCSHVQTKPSFIDRFSTLTHLLRVISRCLRLLQLLRPKRDRSLSAPLNPEEMDNAYYRCVLFSQRVSFPNELNRLGQGRGIKQASPLSSLNPFLDPNGVIRVGGRINQASLPYEQRHPVILAKTCRLASLVIDWAHRTALHGGFSLTYSQVIQRAWVVGGRSKIRAHIRQCIVCARAKARTSTQLMGNLPAERVTPSRPFQRTGVDYAGPFSIKTTKGRGCRSTKGYIALFVCLCTKAVHIEVVGDLTTASFIAAFRRLAGRRGTPREIWSDNATTFHGADVELKAMLREAEIQWDLVAGTLATAGTRWKFIPPAAPHFGGLWEAAVKSAKSHMKRVIGTQRLTYEELSTFTIQIEMCMNSRPLTPITGDVEDLDIITPAHFLTGFPLIPIPEPIRSYDHIDHLTHWRLVQAMRDHFWARWAGEYLHTLQQRAKWTKPRPNFQENDLVLIIDPSLLQQGRWPLGRIQRVYPGRDGLVRTATIRTATGTYDRPIVKLCLLPIPESAPAQPGTAGGDPT